MQTQYKIIADHLRSSCFLIADGALPSNEGRGYVLRRIMRRAMRQLHKIGAKKTMMCDFVDLLIKEMGGAYPELNRARAVIIETLKNEEIQFRKTLQSGLKILNEEIPNTKNQIFSGAIAFKLYDTYGFPLDLTQDILREKNITVNIDEFNDEMKQQKTRAKASWSGSGDQTQNTEFLDLANKFGATKFLGYEKSSLNAKIITVTKNAIILDQTPFYATSGGQKGDEGFIFLESDEKKSAKIKITQKFGDGLFAHFLDENFNNYQFKIGDEIIAKINQETRKNCAKNHSATHLMHKALKATLGDSISQKGSNVDFQYFTFDFNFNGSMTAQEICKVEDLVNFYIKQNSPTKCEIMPIDKARESGAEALFGEKYDDNVRVISMGENQEKSPYSIELCGGTHVKNTGEIEFFKIISEKSIASGIRRITAKTGDFAKASILEELEKLQKIADENEIKISDLKTETVASRGDNVALNQQKSALKINLQNFDEKIVAEKKQNLQQKITQQDQEIKKLTKEIAIQKKQKLLSNLDDLAQEKIGEITLIQNIFDEISAKDLQEITKNLQQKNPQSSVIAVFGKQGQKISACLGVAQNLCEKFQANQLIKEIATKIGGKGGGGKKDLAFAGGNNENGIVDAVEFLRNELKTAG